MDWLVISNILLWVFLVCQLIAFIMLTKLVVQFLNRFRVSGGEAHPLQLRLGQPAPYFRVKDQDDSWISLGENHGQFTLLFFKSNTCGTCHEVLSKLPSIPLVNTRILLVSKEDSNERENHLPANTFFIRSNELFRNYFITKIPSVAIIDPQGRIVHMASIGSFEELQMVIFPLVRQAS